MLERGMGRECPTEGGTDERRKKWREKGELRKETQRTVKGLCLQQTAPLKGNDVKTGMFTASFRQEHKSGLRTVSSEITQRTRERFKPGTLAGCWVSLTAQECALTAATMTSPCSIWLHAIFFF